MKLFQIEAKYENMSKTVRAATRAQAIAQVAKETGIDPKTLFSRSL